VTSFSYSTFRASFHDFILAASASPIFSLSGTLEAKKPKTGAENIQEEGRTDGYPYEIKFCAKTFKYKLIPQLF
jgi:hypothetical protein